MYATDLEQDFGPGKLEANFSYSQWLIYFLILIISVFK